MMQWIRTSWAGGATQLLVGVVLACALSTAAWADDQAGASSVPVEVAARSADEADPGHLAEAAAASVATGSMVRGIIRASSIATISAEINARIVSLPFRDGDRFQKGDVLAAFDCKRLDAEYAAGVADYKAHKLAYENQQRLSGYQAAGMASVEQAQYEAEKAEAEMQALASRQEACTIVAPFSGRVVERAANAYEVAQPNQPLMRIIDDSHLELVLMVPSSWVGSLEPQYRFSFRIDETGKTYAAVISRIGGAIEPVSQSVRLIGEVTEPDAFLLPGMSAGADLGLDGAKP